MPDSTCTQTDCAKRARCKGLCDMHYSRQRRHGSPAVTLRAPHTATEEERLRFTGWTEVQRRPGLTPCWEWNGGSYRLGYGQVSVGGNRCDTASRVAYRVWVGPILDGEDICHRCDNPPCMNPDHLFPGSRTVNMNDSSAKQRLHFWESNGSAKLTEGQVDEIRALYAAGRISQAAVGSMFGVSQTLISAIVRRKIWPEHSTNSVGGTLVGAGRDVPVDARSDADRLVT